MAVPVQERPDGFDRCWDQRAVDGGGVADYLDDVAGVGGVLVAAAAV